MARKLSVSQIPSLIGVWGVDAARQAWAEARGLVEPREQTFRMRLGQEMTPVVLRLAECPESALLEHPVTRDLGAGVLSGRLDAWVPERSEVWEAKTHARTTERSLLAAYLQAQLYAALVEAQHIVCVHLELNSASLVVRNYLYDHELATQLLQVTEYLLEHWEDDSAVDRVQLYTPPAATQPSVLSPEAAALAAIQELLQIREQKAELEAREQALRQQILELLEDGEYTLAQHRVRIETRTRWTVNTSTLPEELRVRYGRESKFRTIVFVGHNGREL